MGPKTDSVATAYERWKEAVEDWNDSYQAFEEEMKSSKKASKSLISHLDTIQKDCMKAF